MGITDVAAANDEAAGPRRLVCAAGRAYQPAVGPWLRPLLWPIFVLFALLASTGFYLFVVRQFNLITYFSILTFGVHELAGIVLIPLFAFFGVAHLMKARRRDNRRAVRLGIMLFVTSIIVVLTGLALLQVEGLPQLPTTSLSRLVTLLLHIVAPVLAAALYVLHRRAGPAIRWKGGVGFALCVVVFVAMMVLMHSHDPNRSYAKGSPEGEKYFDPSLARTPDGNFIAEHLLMADAYCMKCHPDIYKDHLHSSHKFSSFNNPAYLFSVRETRQRAGIRASRWCAGCHDPVPFFSGKFDDPAYDDVKDPTAHAGITCTVCHSITHVASRSGNADYTISAPIHYPFAFSDNSVLQWLNGQLIKAKPDFHKQMFLKPFHRTEAFCSTCHKVGIPQEVSHYKEFLRGQNHPDSFWLSGVSGHGARSFYYPPVAKSRCADCHMPLKASSDFGNQDFDQSGRRTVHNHLFPAANTGLAALAKHAGEERIITAHADFLRGGVDGKSPPLRIDLFGLKLVSIDRLTGASAMLGLAAGAGSGALSSALVLDRMHERGVEVPLIGDEPLRPALPRIVPGSTYQVEVVVRTLNMGHHFTQGTADSNEVWVDFQAKAGKRLIGRSGGMDGSEDRGRVDPSAHFLNVYLLDRNGNRIDRRNPQDIFTPLYDHQIPPGAAHVLHYRFTAPHDLKPGEPIDLSVRVRYRKFDHTYMEHVYGEGKAPKLPIVDLCADRVRLPVAGLTPVVPPQRSPIEPAWQRWNDYGIGCFLEGGPEGKVGGELGQAEKAFARLLTAEFASSKEAAGHGHINLARVHLAYGGSERIEQARQALIEAAKADSVAPWWTVAWFSGLVNMQNARFDEAIADFERILKPVHEHPEGIRDELVRRKFDFSRDYVVINELGKALFLRGQQEEGAQRDAYLRQAIRQFEKTLGIDAEDIVAHEYLAKCYGRLATERSSAIESDPQLAKLLQARQALWQRAQVTQDEWQRLAVIPELHAIDRRLLAELTPLAQRFARDGVGGEPLEEVLSHLAQRPRLANVWPTFFALMAFPEPGLAVNNALAALSERDVLGGGLPPTRLLTLVKVRQHVHPMKDSKEPVAANDAVRILARLHLILHAIYKPDENAQDNAARIARSRNPAANRASHAIVIYPVR